MEQKVVKEWLPQVKISLDVTHNGKKHHICNYFIDFKVWYANGEIQLVEVKGLETDVWKLKRGLMEAVYLPDHLDETYVVVK